MSVWLQPHLSSMQCACAVLYYLWPLCFYHIFSTVCHKRHDFRKKNIYIEHKMCFFIFSDTYV